MGERSKIALALCALTLAVYAEVGTHAFVDFDDTKHIAQNPDVAPGWSAERMVRVFTHPHFGDFIPLTYLSLQLDRSLFGPAQPRALSLRSVAWANASFAPVLPADAQLLERAEEQPRPPARLGAGERERGNPREQAAKRECGLEAR